MDGLRENSENVSHEEAMFRFSIELLFFATLAQTLGHTFKKEQEWRGEGREGGALRSFLEWWRQAEGTPANIMTLSVNKDTRMKQVDLRLFISVQ